MYEELKQKDIDVLAYLKDHSSRYGYPPSVREICKKLDIKSTSTVFAIIKRLEKHNYIRKDPTKPRAIEILDRDTESSSLNYNDEVLRLPLVGQIAAGSPILAEENIEEYIALPSSYVKNGSSFMLKVKGDSMLNAGILDGDYIIIDPSNKNPSNGKMVAALIDGDTSTVKTLERRDNKIILKPENPDYQPMIFNPSQVSILGLVSGVFRVI